MTDDLLPEDTQDDNFRTALRGYDKRDVNDYLDRVEATFREAEQRHAADLARAQELEQEVRRLQAELAEAQRLAEGRPEPARVSGERIATMLRLAEEEAEQLRAEAREQVASMLAAGREEAERQSAQRAADIERRELELRTALEEADRVILQARRDADAIRAEAEDERRQQLEAGQLEAAAMTAEARRQVEDLSRQRDEVLAHVQELQTLLARVSPPVAAGYEEAPTQAIPRPQPPAGS